jgi:hypothetical protein
MATSEIVCTLESGVQVVFEADWTEADDVEESPTWYEIFAKTAGK